MKGLRGLWGRMIPAVAFLVLFVGAVTAQAGFVSGTVTNNTVRTGRVFVSLENASGGNGGFGVSIPNPSADTPFTIRGVPNGTYTLKAFVDGSGTGRLHANDPTWSSPGNITISNDNYVDGPNSTIEFSTLPNVPPLAPSGTTPVKVLPGDNGAFVSWDEPRDGINGPRSPIPTRSTIPPPVQHPLPPMMASLRSPLRTRHLPSYPIPTGRPSMSR